MSFATASSSFASRSAGADVGAIARVICTSCSLESSSALRSLFQRPETTVTSRVSASGCMYDPPTIGRSSGVRMRFAGHPALPVIEVRNAMYVASTSGCSSRSTSTGTNSSFRIFAMAASVNDSRSMTWHQWQLA
jgi:hypothetical protein